MRRVRLPLALLLCLSATALAQGPAAAPQEVKVGVFLRNVESIDLEHNAYFLSFVLWMKWKGPIDPTKSFRFVNLIEAWATTAAPVYDEPLTLDDGSRYQRFHVEGRFVHKFRLGAYPLDSQDVVLELEDARHPVSELVYVAEPESRAVEKLVVPGWTIAERLMKVTREPYPGGLGLGAAAAEHSRFQFGLQLQRPLRLMLFTMAPPVLLVLLCCFAVFFLRPTHVEARIGTVITALLTVVFLQLAFTDDLPWLGNSVLLDQLFNVSYVVMTAALIECVVVTRLHDQALALEALAASAEAQARAGHLAAAAALRTRIARLDRLSARLFPPLYLAGCLAIVFASAQLGSVPF